MPFRFDGVRSSNIGIRWLDTRQLRGGPHGVDMVRVGVDLRGQPDVGVPHELHRFTDVHLARSQERTEGDMFQRNWDKTRLTASNDLLARQRQRPLPELAACASHADR